MGSQPWKQAQMDRWEDEFSGERVRVSTTSIVYSRPHWEPTSEREVCGMFVGQGSKGQQKCVIVNTSPPGASVRDPGYFDRERWIVVDRSVAVVAQDEEQQR